MAVASRFEGSSRPLDTAGCNSSLPTFAESLRILSALVTYLRIWVDSWAATQLLATKKMKAKQRTRNTTLPTSVIQGGGAHRRRVLPEDLPGLRTGRRPEPPPAPPLRRTFGPDLWDLRSTNNLPARRQGALPPRRRHTVG